MLQIPARLADSKRLQGTSQSYLGWGIACALLFVLLGCIFVDYAGVQTDEGLFAAPLFRAWRFFSVPLAQHNVPLMNMSYNGTLKTWLYAPLVLFWRPSAALIRIPAILMGGATILLFCALLYRIHGRRAAWVGGILLATDTSFLLTTTFDWGPVVLQHLLLVAALFFAVRWFQTTAAIPLSAAAFCCGLALWDKAVFLWVFTGILAGSLRFAREIRRRLTWRQALAATSALCLGALPLIVYNLVADPRFGTVRANPRLGADWTLQELEQKFQIERSTWQGSALLGYLVYEDNAPRPRGPDSQLERASFTLRELAGQHRRNQLGPALCIALLLIPLLWRTRAREPILFCLIAIAISWLHMAIAGGGGAAHHSVLLWPLPHLLLAAAFAEASLHLRFGQWVLAAAVSFLAVTNLLVTNQYLYQFIRNGAADVWTDAIYPLVSGLDQTPASQIVVNDWGMTDSLCVLDGGKPPVRQADDPFLAPGQSPGQKQYNLETLADAKAIWVEHTPGHESLTGINGRLSNAARRFGFEPVILETYRDRNGRAILQTLRFARTPAK